MYAQTTLFNVLVTAESWPLVHKCGAVATPETYEQVHNHSKQTPRKINVAKRKKLLANPKEVVVPNRKQLYAQSAVMPAKIRET